MYTRKMGKFSSNETLDSTLDSRMSSSDIPKMELLKINYVHQCKEALMPRSTEALTPRLPPRMSSSAGNFNFSPFNKGPPESAQNGHVTKVMLGTANKNSLSQLPLPTIESWNFLQNSETNSTPSTPTTPKFVVQERPLEDSDDNEHFDRISCCNSTCLSSSSESEQTSSTDTLKNPHAEKSNSWYYRGGVKSRAERIAHIERTECDHLQQIPPTTTSTDMVSRINQLFAGSDAKSRPSIQKNLPQPRRPAPLPIKEPNMRRRPYSVSSTETSSSCSCANSDADSWCDNNRKTESLGNRNRNSPANQGKLLSRIPKPINDLKQRSVKNEQQQQRQINEMFGQGNQQSRKLKPQMDAKSKMRASKSIDELTTGIKPKSEQNVRESEHLSDFDHKLLRNACQSYGADNYKMKVERIHIRKKRHPLLIINQLNSDETKTCNTEYHNKIDPPTCGLLKKQEEEQMKRSSLESCSDSGISSTHDTQDHAIEKNNLKNLAKCSDYVKIQHTTAFESEHESFDAASKGKILDEKPKEIEPSNDDQQIKIYVRKPQKDPNDVQYFSNKNLTKITTDEILNTATTKSKQCNIENDIKNMEQRKNNHSSQTNTTTTINIDDNWVKESADILNETMDSDFLKPTALKSQRKPINCSDNAVKIFVRSSSSTGATANSSRASSVSTMSYASQTSGFSSASSISSAASTKSTSSICECMQRNHEKCVQAYEGLFINMQEIPEVPLRIRPKDACLPPPSSISPCPSSGSSCSFALHNNPSNIGGVFWNNSYFCNESDMAADANIINNNNEQCCCECVSSCEEDNCSYYGIECVTSAIPKTAPPPPLHARGKNTYVDPQNNSIMIKKQPNKKSNYNNIEELLIRKNKLMRKVSQWGNINYS